MEPRTYLRAVDAAVREGVPDALGEIRHRGRGSLAKWWYGNPAIHYGEASVLGPFGVPHLRRGHAPAHREF